MELAAHCGSLAVDCRQCTICDRGRLPLFKRRASGTPGERAEGLQAVSAPPVPFQSGPGLGCCLGECNKPKPSASNAGLSQPEGLPRGTHHRAQPEGTSALRRA